MNDIDKQIYELPFIVVRGLCVFPGTAFNVDIIRHKSYEAMEAAVEEDGLIFVVAQIDPSQEAIKEDNLYGTGVIARIKRVARMPGNVARISADGLMRARIKDIFGGTTPYLRGQVIRMDSVLTADELHIKALTKMLGEAVIRYSSLNPRFFADNIWGNDSLAIKVDRLASSIDLDLDEKQHLLEQLDVFERGMDLCKLINRENAVLSVKNELNVKVKEKIDGEQRKYFLREQLKVINEELGDEGVNAEIAEYREKIKAKKIPEYAEQKLEKELDRLKRLANGRSGRFCNKGLYRGGPFFALG